MARTPTDPAHPSGSTRDRKPSNFKRPPTAQEAVSAELRREILEGELPPGTQILQDRLAEQLGVSRVPVREALKILEGEGQISYEPHRGYFVTELDLKELREVYQIRNLLEAEAVRLAIPLMSSDDDDRMDQALRDTEDAGRRNDIVALTAANRRFHFAMIDPCGLTRLVRIIRQLWDATDPYRSVYFGESEHRGVVIREHRQIVKAVKTRDVDTVVELLAAHRAGTVASLQRLLDTASPAADDGRTS